jgi:hypothetical protein
MHWETQITKIYTNRLLGMTDRLKHDYPSSHAINLDMDEDIGPEVGTSRGEPFSCAKSSCGVFGCSRRIARPRGLHSELSRQISQAGAAVNS